MINMMVSTWTRSTAAILFFAVVGGATFRYLHDLSQDRDIPVRKSSLVYSSSSSFKCVNYVPSYSSNRLVETRPSSSAF